MHAICSIGEDSLRQPASCIMQLEETFRGTVAHAQRRIQELKEKHFLEPAGADFCEGQVLKVSHTTLHPHHLKTFHCYEPTCQQRWCNSNKHHKDRDMACVKVAVPDKNLGKDLLLQSCTLFAVEESDLDVVQ
eukprot:204193-Pelagomonas_calceolata.AAC.1